MIMGKANKVKYDLLDATEMVDLLQTLKDVAENKFFTLQNQKDKFRRFGETFVEFFRLLRTTEVQHPLVSNTYSKTAILVVTIEGSFVGEFNSKIVRAALEQKEKYKDSEFYVIGGKGADKLSSYQKDIKVWTDMENKGLYETAIEVKDFFVQEIMEGRLGRVVVAYAWPKSYETQKSRIIKLLPCEDLISKQAQYVDIVEKVIEESDPIDIIGKLSDLWVTTRLYSIFIDTVIASAAAQANFLEDSLDKQRKEHKKVQLKYRKAKKEDIDKGLRETCTARMMITK